MQIQTIVVLIHVPVAMALVGLILIQRGKGAEAGAAFGSGASQTVFGARGSASFLTRLTAILAMVFFTTSLTLAYFTQQGTERKSVVEMVAPMPMPQAPANQSDVPAVPLPKEPAAGNPPSVPEK
jgi:preprotein translocase subunit SecG